MEWSAEEGLDVFIACFLSQSIAANSSVGVITDRALEDLRQEARKCGGFVVTAFTVLLIGLRTWCLGGIRMETSQVGGAASGRGGAWPTCECCPPPTLWADFSVTL
jgi:hypothetical protein